MPKVKEIRLKNESRFTPENDEDFNLFCKCVRSIFAENRDGDPHINDYIQYDGFGDEERMELLRMFLDIKFNRRPNHE